MKHLITLLLLAGMCNAQVYDTASSLLYANDNTYNTVGLNLSYIDGTWSAYQDVWACDGATGEGLTRDCSPRITGLSNYPLGSIIRFEHTSNILREVTRAGADYGDSVWYISHDPKLPGNVGTSEAGRLQLFILN